MHNFFYHYLYINVFSCNPNFSYVNCKVYVLSYNTDLSYFNSSSSLSMSYTLRPIVKWQPDFHEAIIVLWQPFADHTNVIQTDSVGLYNFMPVLDLKCHLQDENVNEIFARPVLQDLEERFRNYLDTSMKEFDPVPAAACLLTSEMENVWRLSNYGW